MQNLLGWWDSYQSLSTIGTFLKFIAATSGVLVLILGLRESSLRSVANAAEKAEDRRKISEAEAKAERLRRAAIPREVTSEQRAIIASMIATEQPPFPMQWTIDMSDREAGTYAEAVRSAFSDAGLPFAFQGIINGYDLPAGITVNPEHPDNSSGCLARILKAAKIPFSEVVPPRDRTGVDPPPVIIGRKPPEE